MKVSSVQPFASLLFALIALSCESKKETAPPDLPQVAASANPPEAEKTAVKEPWFSGLWRGESELSEDLSVEDQDATSRGERRSGQTLGPPMAFQLQLTVSTEGAGSKESAVSTEGAASKDVRGTAKLGEHQADVNGVLLDGSLRVNFRGDVLQGNWNGVRRESGPGAMFSGIARASTTTTTDERQRVRRYSGSVELTKVEEKK